MNIVIFVDLEKARDRVLRYIIWWAVGNKKENCWRIIHRICMLDVQHAVTTPLGSTESFEVKVGLHQGSALRALLFITEMDIISE